MESPTIIHAFDRHFREWAAAACAEWSLPAPPQDFYVAAAARLPSGLRTLLAEGIAEGLVIPHGPVFTLKGLAVGKGPYAWFSRYESERRPNPNWEYYVQAAEFVRLHRLARVFDMEVTFEDQLMDLALYKGGTLLVCVEVKERAGQIQRLVREIRNHESGIDREVPDRHNDPLRKAKYIADKRPFELVPDVVPWA
jgi:hypothetical protein